MNIADIHEAFERVEGALGACDARDSLAKLKTALVNALARTEGHSSTAREMYEDYCASTGGVSAVTGATLPDFGACSEPVRRAWQHVAETSARRAGLPPPPVETPGQDPAAPFASSR